MGEEGKDDASSPPSGAWKGYYLYSPGGMRHRQDLTLTFSRNMITGDGMDDVGKFLIRGRYDGDGRETHWTKTYPGSHDVFYRGFYEGKCIWGTWETDGLNRGGFRIWPAALGEAEGIEEKAEVDVEVSDCVGA
ncbi:MAG: hypothetical protein NTW87_13905 [Planctomycetota bacterium]|nr:hypothetical protein [Planctomycetota bacterium]